MADAAPFSAASAASRAGQRNPWILSPALDLLFCCGGLAWILAGLTLLAQRASLGDPARAAAIRGGVVLSMLFSNAHTTATLIRLYEIPAARERLRFYTLTLPALMAALGLAAFVFPVLPPVLGKVYLLWNAFHWSGQTYGIALVYCYKRDYLLTPYSRRLLWGTINASAVVSVVRSCTDPAYGTARFVGMPMPFWGPLPVWVSDAAQIGTAIVATLWIADLVRRWREDGRLMPAPALLVAGTGFMVWFWSGRLADALWLFVVPLYHGSQYVAVNMAWRLKTKDLPAGFAPRDVAQRLTSPAALRYYALLVLGGGFVYETLPHVSERVWLTRPGVALLIITSVVNFHHFLTDQAIWKLRDKDVRDTLLA